MKRPELKGQLVCMECGYLGPPNTFPCQIDAVASSKRCCPHCHETDIRPAEQIEWCEQCREYPASSIIGSQGLCDTCNETQEFDDGDTDDYCWPDLLEEGLLSLDNEGLDTDPKN